MKHRIALPVAKNFAGELIVFVEHQINKGVKELTIKRKSLEIKRFFLYLEAESKDDIRDVTRGELESFLLWLKDQGKSASTLIVAKSALADLFKALYKSNRILANPFSLLEFYVTELKPEKVILSMSEMATLLDSIPVHTGMGMRDRCLFELLYATGMRIGEAIRLTVKDVDLAAGQIFIQNGKNDKDRIVPIGENLSRYLKTYMDKVRLWFVVDELEERLFLNQSGARFSASTIRWRLKEYLKKAGITKKNVTVHSFRHSCATHLLENGADIRFVQELLGHEKLETTAHYTQQVVTGLRKLHKTYHPRENELYPE